MRISLFVLLLVTTFIAAGQDGKIIEQTRFEVSDSVRNKNKPAADFYSITYLSDALKIKGFIAIPADGNIHPCVLFSRGGNENYSMLTNESFARKAGFLLDNGYIFAATQYRGSLGSEGKDEFGGGDVDDVVNLIKALGNIAKADTSRVALFGWSRGAINTYVALTKAPNINAAVVGGGMSDLIKLRDVRKMMDTGLFQKLIPGYSETKNDDLLKQRSAFYIADNILKNISILILHGTADGNVPTSQSISLAQKFYEVRQPFRLILYEGAVHSIEQFRGEYESEIIRWLNRYVKDGKKAPDLEPVFKR
jgi:dipeptidyl aminopeptidase/acylaminoacyl peptidase